MGAGRVSNVHSHSAKSTMQVIEQTAPDPSSGSKNFVDVEPVTGRYGDADDGWVGRGGEGAGF